MDNDQLTPMPMNMHTAQRGKHLKSDYLPDRSDSMALMFAGTNATTRLRWLGLFLLSFLFVWCPLGRLMANDLDNVPISGPDFPLRYLLSYKVDDRFPNEFGNGYSAFHFDSHSVLAPIDGITALKVTGISGASTPDTIDLSEDSYSISVWFRPDHLPGQNGTPVDFPILSLPNNLKLRLNQDGKFYASFHQIGIGIGGAVLTEVESPQYNQWEQWYHLCKVVNYGAQTITLYVNGQAVGSASFDSTLPPEVYTESWMIGYGPRGGGTWASGYFWDARMYDTALLPSEVEAVFATSPIDTDVDGLPDWWEIMWFGDITSYSGSDPSPGDPSITVLQAYLEGRNPHAITSTGVDANEAVELLVFLPL